MVTRLWTRIVYPGIAGVMTEGILPLEAGKRLTVECYAKNHDHNIPPGNYIIKRVDDELISNGSGADDRLTRIIELELRK